MWSSLRARFVCAQHDLGQTAARVSGTVRHVMEQPGLAELREDLKDFKRRAEAQIESVTGELAIVKNCIMQLYNVLLPGKFSMQHLQAAPAMPLIPSCAQNFPLPMQPLPQAQPLPRVSSAHHGASQHPGYPQVAAVRPAASHPLLQVRHPAALLVLYFGNSPFVHHCTAIQNCKTTALGSICLKRSWTTSTCVPGGYSIRQLHKGLITPARLAGVWAGRA